MKGTFERGSEDNEIGNYVSRVNLLGEGNEVW